MAGGTPAPQAQGHWDFLQRWVFFIAFIAVLPILFSILIGPMAGKQISYESIFGSGELLVAALAIAADSCGSLTREYLRGRTLAIFLGCLAMVVLCTGLVSCTVTKLIPTETFLIANVSSTMFVCSFIVSFIGKLVSRD